MDFAICLDQFSTNFNVNSLSSNGFSIYTNLDYNNPIASGVPYQDLFAPPIGNCPLVVNVPQGATQLLVIDACTTLPTNVAPIFSAGSSANSLVTQCCYAVIPIPVEPISWCNTANLDFDVFSSSYIGQIVAGNLNSSLGTVTDYKIGWYKDGDYSAPEFTSGKGTAFTPYQFQHPLIGNSAVPALAGNWEGIIHDIAINGTTYSSVSGSANGTPIPFESCFGTIVVDPLTCNNGPISSSISKYSHQITFNSQAVGSSPNPVSLTYTLNPSIKYFAYVFQGYSIWDEVEIKFISGNPSATNNPSLYSQPIYLEKIKIGSDAPTIGTFPNTNALPVQNNPNTNIVLNNIWPKKYDVNSTYQRTLTLTTLQTSSNPLTPDHLEITITPNPTNNNTQWKAGFQCLTNFDCADCVWENYPNNLPKIYQIKLAKLPTSCAAQRLQLSLTSSCPAQSITSDWMGWPIPPGGFNIDPFNSPTSNLIGSYTQPLPVPSQNFPSTGYLALSPNISCGISNLASISCGSSSTGQITLTKSFQQIQLTFNLESDYLHYKNSLINEYNTLSTQNTLTPLTSSIPCPAGSTNVSYYRGFYITIPTQGINANCGDSSIPITYRFHYNDYFNITYNENPSSNSWSITIPQTPIVNCYPLNSSCDSCYNIVDSYVTNYNAVANNVTPYTFTTNVGAKYADPIRSTRITRSVTGGTSGSYCISQTSPRIQFYPWYATHTVPFISSSTGWVNLQTLQAFVGCVTSSFPNSIQVFPDGNIFAGTMYNYQVRFPNLTSSFNYSLSTNDFEIYALAGFGATGSNSFTPGVSPAPCFDPSGSKIYSYVGGVATMHSSSHFWNGTTPTLVIDP